MQIRRERMHTHHKHNQTGGLNVPSLKASVHLLHISARKFAFAAKRIFRGGMSSLFTKLGMERKKTTKKSLFFTQ